MSEQMNTQLLDSQVRELEEKVEETTEKIKKAAEAGLNNPTAEGFKTILSLVKEMAI